MLIFSSFKAGLLPIVLSVLGVRGWAVFRTAPLPSFVDVHAV